MSPERRVNPDVLRLTVHAGGWVLTVWSLCAAVLAYCAPTFLGDFIVQELSAPHWMASTVLSAAAALMVCGRIMGSTSTMLLGSAFNCVTAVGAAAVSAAAVADGAHASMYVLNWVFVAVIFMLYALMLTMRW